MNDEETRDCDDCGRVTDASDFPDWPNGRCEDCDPETVREGVLELAEMMLDDDSPDVADWLIEWVIKEEKAA